MKWLMLFLVFIFSYGFGVGMTQQDLKFRCDDGKPFMIGDKRYACEEIV